VGSSLVVVVILVGNIADFVVVVAVGVDDVVDVVVDVIAGTWQCVGASLAFVEKLVGLSYVVVFTLFDVIGCVDIAVCNT